ITTILTLKMLSSQPEKSVKIINGIADSYLRQSVEQKSAEKQKTIDFIQAQLPEVKERMTLAENALNDFRLTQGSIDLKSETQSLLERILVIENKLSTLDLKAAEMKLKFTDNHPLMKTLTSQRQRLYQQMQKLSSQVKVLPETEQRILRLAQKVKVNSQLYTFLFNKYQEMKVLKAGTIGNARIIDYAIIPYRANKSNKNKTLLLAILIGLIIGAMIVFARHFMRYNIENPEDIERQFDLALYAVIPHSEQQIKLAKSLDKNNDESLLLAEKNIDDLAIEGLRSLRTNLHFALMGAKNNIVMITGASEGLGKSFISVNFAHVISQAGKSVLIIDGDMRKGHLARYLGKSQELGLSDVISARCSFASAVIKHNDMFSLLPCGSYPPNPSELLMHEDFASFIDEVSSKYDIVIIDTPPVLAVTDAVLIGKYAASSFLLVRSGKTNKHEIKSALQTLERGHIKVDGAIFNDLPQKTSKYSAYGHYSYAYKRD
ncbi:MAG: polysaccharide biosynthesis tyrosine autokinase, partial [Mariprofundales bacterium]